MDEKTMAKLEATYEKAQGRLLNAVPSGQVVIQGQAVLDRLGIRATLFVCPGLVDTDRPFWWEVVDAALALGIRPGTVAADARDEELALHMKVLPDARRRALVAELEEAVVERTGQPLRRRQVTEAELRGWGEAGHGIGNHTWDHPCLDRCDPESQLEQVAAADRWLRERWPSSLRVFAYPNGNWSPATEDALTRYGYRLAVLFDHRLSRVSAPPLRLSRLRISSDAPLSRFRSILSGTHSSALRLGARLRRKPAPADAPP